MPQTLEKYCEEAAAELAGYDVVITTYTLIRRSTWPLRCPLENGRAG